MSANVEFYGFGDTVILNHPVFGDLDTVEHLRINRTTRGGQLRIYRDPQWPIVRKIKVKFEDLNYFQSKNILLFMQKWVGRKINMLDHMNRTWEGIILSNQAPVSQNKRADFDFCPGGYSIELEFEGKIVS